MGSESDSLANLRGHLLASEGDQHQNQQHVYSYPPSPTWGPSRGGSTSQGDATDTAWWPTILLLWIIFIAVSGFAFALRGLPWWYEAIMGGLVVFVLAMLLLTVAVDPGIVQPDDHVDPLVLALDCNQPDIPQRDAYERDWRGQWTRTLVTSQQQEETGCCGGSSGGSSGGGSGEQSRVFGTDGTVLVVQRYCRTCNLWRDPRVSHCKVCGHCFERYDHHCHVLGTCVARRNHRFFAALLMGCQAGSLWLLAGTCWRLRDTGFPSTESWRQSSTYLLLILALLYLHHVLLMLFGVGHCCSIVLDVTTKDLLSARAVAGRAPRAGAGPGSMAGTGPGQQGSHDRPCGPGTKSPRRLLSAWRSVCCAPVRLREDVRKQLATCWGTGTAQAETV